jgi:hypothetical protein
MEVMNFYQIEIMAKTKNKHQSKRVKIGHILTTSITQKAINETLGISSLTSKITDDRQKNKVITGSLATFTDEIIN